MNPAAPPKLKSRKSRWLRFGFPICLLFIVLLFYLGSMRLITVHRAHSTFTKIQKNIDPEELRQWAVDLARRFHNGEHVPKSELPKTLLNLGRSPPKIGIPRRTADATDDSRCYVILIWGGGFFHWGMLIGSPQFQHGDENHQHHIIQWVPGIYFDHEGEDWLPDFL